MAVVSISRIQVRRGKAGEGTGLPQLASGEFGWAIDTQELYIGNGSTSEGAPAVGNTQILTSNTNVIELVGQYTYRADSNIQTSETVPVERSIAERLDDRVSLRAFGGASQTEQLQKAFYELYLRGNDVGSTITPITNAEAPILYIEPGVFTITETIYVPPFTTIIGAGKNKTIFRKTGDFDMFRTIGSESFYDGLLGNSIEVFTPDSVANQSRNIRFEDMTLQANQSGTSVSSDYRSYLLRLESCRDSTFKNVCFTYSGGSLISDREVAVGAVSKNDTVCTNNNRFIDCDFIGTREAAYGPYTVKDNTFVRCTFDYLRRGVIFGYTQAEINDAGNSITLPVEVGQSGPQDNVISNSQFSNVSEEAFLASAGTGNKSENNRYGENVGNNNGGDPAYPIVSYGERGNFSVDDTFERTYNLAVNIGNTGLLTYHPEVKGPIVYTNGTTPITTISGGSPAFRLPADASRFYTVEYFYRSSLDNINSLARVGTLNIIVKIDTVNNSRVDLVDEYEYIGIDGALGGSINFKSELQYDDEISPTEIRAVRILVEPNGNGPDFDGDGNPDGIGGELVIKITSKS